MHNFQQISREASASRALCRSVNLLLLTAASFAASAQSSDLSRLQNLLDVAQPGVWIMSSTTSFRDSAVIGAAANPYGSYGSQNLQSTIYAWSSMTIDPRNGDLYLAAAGGHANYAGNEVRRNRGDTGAWELASLPSRLDADNYVVDAQAPQSSHQYDNTNWLSVNNRVVTLGGAAYQSGGGYADPTGRAGPWLFDPAKADAGKVGGSTGSGFDPTSQGGLMWENRQSRAVGIQGPDHVNGTSASTVENGRDVVYFTADSNSSGWPNLYRLTLGNGAESDLYSVVGVSRQSFGFQGVGTFDATRGLYVRTGVGSTSSPGVDLSVWNLREGLQVWDQPITLTFADGRAFEGSRDFGMDYDSAHDIYVLWDGKAGGTTYYTHANFIDGVLQSNWTVYEAQSQSTEQPRGSFATGVLGKFKYVDSLGAFMALDEMDADGFANVWLYKPDVNVLAVPEPAAGLLLLLGLVLITARRFRNSQAPQDL